MIKRTDKRYLDGWLFIDSLLNAREAAKRMLYWIEEAESTGASARQDMAHDRIRLLAKLLATRDHVQVEES